MFFNNVHKTASATLPLILLIFFFLSIIGQAGKGNSEEFGLLSLEFDENFCMGGPGVIMSRETLRRVAPHIPTCLKNLYSTHEDVEIGRCVQKFAGIPCTWNYEVSLSIESFVISSSSQMYL